jgi:hypothetical protein
LNVLLVAGCVAIIFQRQGAFAALLAAAIIFTFSFLIRYIPTIAKAQPKEILWNINAYKTLALIGGSFIVAVYFLRANSPRSGKIFLVIGTIFLSLFFIISGFAHFKFAGFIIDRFYAVVHSFHPFWTYFLWHSFDRRWDRNSNISSQKK